MYRNILLFMALGMSLAACGENSLRTPIHTCKAVLNALSGNRSIIFHSEQQTEKKGEKITVQVSFAFVEQGNNAPLSTAECIYGLSSQDMDYRNAMGEYANTPTQMQVNNQAIPMRDLVQAVNLATARSTGLMR